MKPYTEKSTHHPKIILSLIILTVGIFLAAQIAYGAGTPRSTAPAPRDSREKANEYFDAGKRLQEAQRYKEASKEYEKAVRNDDAFAEAHSNLGYTYRKQGLFEKAVKSYKKAIQLNPRLAEAHEYLGEAYAEMGKFEEAENELKILRELGSDEADELEAFIRKMRASKG